jgi:hypothetical protein
MGCLTALS